MSGFRWEDPESDFVRANVEPDHPSVNWPICGHAMTLLGYDLCCTLPDGHELDGSQYHCNDEGVEWIVTRSDPEGTDVSFRHFPFS